MNKRDWLCIALLVVSGCARFSTVQKDISTINKDGSETRTITTTAKASTFFEAKSALATWKATQTDRSQGATVGGLEQQSTGTNTVKLIEALAALVGALPK
jgi:hypothetical protein